MDESTCLLRSFSNPLDVSREVKEGDPIHALTQSISFGRFMSESLAWEKWSTFSLNRYLEEMEKLSKPGSVAEKKAFFEAHYKKRAAMRAAALLVTNEAFQTGTINAPSAEPLLDADLANSNGSPAANQHGKDVSYADIANTAGVDACNLTLVRENIDVSDPKQGLAAMEEDVNMEECHQIQISNALESGDIHGKIMTTPKIPTPPEECADSKTSTSSSKKRRTSSSSKSSVPSKASKLPLHPSKRVASAEARSDANFAKPTGNLIEKRKPTPNSLLMSINVAGKTNKTPLRTTPPQSPTRALKKAADQENLAPSSEKRQSNSALKLPNHGRGSKHTTSRTGNNQALINNKKPILDPNEQRRTAQKSLHMSMNSVRVLVKPIKLPLRFPAKVQHHYKLQPGHLLMEVQSMLPKLFSHEIKELYQLSISRFRQQEMVDGHPTPTARNLQMHVEPVQDLLLAFFHLVSGAKKGRQNGKSSLRS